MLCSYVTNANCDIIGLIITWINIITDVKPCLVNHSECIIVDRKVWIHRTGWTRFAISFYILYSPLLSFILIKPPVPGCITWFVWWARELNECSCFQGPAIVHDDSLSCPTDSCVSYYAMLKCLWWKKVNNRPLKLKQLNRIEPSLMLFTPVLSLIWHVKTPSIKRCCVYHLWFLCLLCVCVFVVYLQYSSLCYVCDAFFICLGFFGFACRFLWCSPLISLSPCRFDCTFACTENLHWHFLHFSAVSM